MNALNPKSLFRYLPGMTLAAGLLLDPGSAHAMAERQPLAGGKGQIATSRKLGLGLDSGSPIYGINLKYFMTPGQAIQLTVGGLWGGGLGVEAEYLFHPRVLIQSSVLVVPFYVGGGVAAGTWGNNPYFNLHIPVGLSFELQQVPLDLFVQMEPSFAMYKGSPFFDFNGGGGIRFYF